MLFNKILDNKILNLVVSKQENHNLRSKNAIMNGFKYGRKRKHSFFADTSLQIGQIKWKKEAKFNKPLFI